MMKGSRAVFPGEDMPKINRRGFLKGASVTVGAATLPAHAQTDAENENAVPLSPQVTPMRNEEDVVPLRLRVNNVEKACETTVNSRLVNVLREDLGLTGTKLCCGGGSCGACTVHIDGEAAASCLTLAVDAEGKEITTIEGLAPGPALHPVQQAFIDADALQCGYCTPGMIMSASSFYDQWTKRHGVGQKPSASEIQSHMAGNLCRCGAQPAIIIAIQAACMGQTAEPPGGKPTDPAMKRIDALEKVRGEAKYTLDVYPEGGLHGYILRSPHAHATVNNIDMTTAATMPGVKALVKLLPAGTVRYHHQAIAAVAAETYAQAKKAAQAIEVDYTPKPTVSTMEQALSPNAPLVYEKGADVSSASEGPAAPAFLFEWEENRRVARTIPFADDGEDTREAIEKSPARTLFEGSTSVQVHAALERHGCVAIWGKNDAGEDILTMHASTQTVQILQSDLADSFDLPKSRVHVKAAYVGGGFGSKAGLRVEHLASAKLAKKAGKPVRVILPFDTHLVVGGNRPGTSHSLRIGADKTGKLQGIHHLAKNLCGTAVGEKSTGLTSTHYACENVFIEDESVVTHSAPGCPFRAPGHPANAFALEQAMDDIAAQSNQDPLTMRIAQGVDERKRLVYELLRRHIRAPERLTNVASPAQRSSSERFLRGTGVATGEWFVLTSPSCQVEIKAFRDGNIEISTAAHDMGQGARTVLAQAVLETLNVPAERISVKVGDSGLVSAPGAFGSITTGSIAPAAHHAAQELKEAIIGAAARKIPGSRPDAWGLKTKEDKLLQVKDLFEHLPSDPFTIIGRRGADRDGFQYMPAAFNFLSQHSPFAMGKDIVTSAYVADVVVDRDLGRVQVEKITVALDAGKLASPITARSQVIGAAIQGLSYGLYEERNLDRNSARQLSTNFETYAICGIGDTPQVDVHFLDRPSPNNPYGTLGLGENAIVAASAAVANGFFRATGKRIREAPLTPDKVLKALAG